MKTGVTAAIPEPPAATREQRISELHRRIAELHLELAQEIAGEAQPAPAPAAPPVKRCRGVQPLVVAPVSAPSEAARARARAQLDRKGFRAP